MTCRVRLRIIKCKVFSVNISHFDDLISFSYYFPVENTKSAGSPYSRFDKWPQKAVERLMTIYWEMKARSGQNDWVYVSKKLGIHRYTNMDCAKKVRRLLRKNGENYMKKALNSPLTSSGASVPSCTSEEACKLKVRSFNSTSLFVSATAL